jgi:hypothetical protein
VGRSGYLQTDNHTVRTSRSGLTQQWPFEIQIANKKFSTIGLRKSINNFIYVQSKQLFGRNLLQNYKCKPARFLPWTSCYLTRRGLPTILRAQLLSRVLASLSCICTDPSGICCPLSTWGAVHLVAEECSTRMRYNQDLRVREVRR